MRLILNDGPDLPEILSVVAFSTLFSLGGGNGQLAIIQDYWVESGILSSALFAWAYAIGNLVPGPKCSFVAGIGYFLAGIPGSLACLLGISIPTIFGASLAAHLYEDLKRFIAVFVPASSFVISGMMFTASAGLANSLSINLYEYFLVVIIILGIWLKKWDPGLVVLASGGIGLLVYVLE